MTRPMVSDFPRIIFGTSSLGNLYREVPEQEKKGIVEACLRSGNQVLFDTAGKYGAGLSLQSLGRYLHELGADPRQVLISNKLGWLSVPLKTPEPTFEKGVWFGLHADAEQHISYDGIMACYQQGNDFLGIYKPQLLSVHDPDEYLTSASGAAEREQRYRNILEAYRALHELKQRGEITSVGIGAKDWRTIRELSEDVALDWVMLANSLTVYQHPADLLAFISEMNKKGIQIINSAVFHGGFLTGSDYFNYNQVSRETHPALYTWRDHFYGLCDRFGIDPAAAAVQFAFTVPGITSVALNSSSASRTAENALIGTAPIPEDFWSELKTEGLIDANYPYL
ncbi:aldo/keto reductase [Pedobacter sp. SYP-B3415]|uniref:aldo/keto reductase n=1 Tax=Pedobacter sp. SYP-B3415 TaxID=2496641 RepID=UPI001F0DD5C7|nr:aldo/keto reductase [Pedobacter sp. SYP-B3415]